MRSIALTGAAGAVGIGLLIGAGLAPGPADTDRPGGPQLVYSNPRDYAGGESEDPGLTARAGPLPEYVLGTDWTRPRNPAPIVVADYRPQADNYDAAVMPVLQQASYTAPSRYAVYPSTTGDIRAMPPSVGQPQSLAQSGGEQGKVGIGNDQWRGQVDDLAHRSDPGALVGEAAAKRATLDGRIELDHADRAQNPDIDDAG